jgi:hypothetical protein
MELARGLLTNAEEAAGVAARVGGIGVAVDHPIKHDEERAIWETMASREALRCSYAWAKMTTSSRDEGCCRATSVHRGSLSR